MKKIITFIYLMLFVIVANAKTYNILDFGANGDGKFLNTVPIQNAIDAAHANGGGKVVLPTGVFLSGTIFLKSNVNLYLSNNAILMGSTDFYHYEKNRWFSLIMGINATNITVSGKGTIDGQGRALAKNVFNLVLAGKIADKLDLNRPHESWRPQIIELSNCSNIAIRDVTIKNGSGWVQTYIKCENLSIKNTITESTSYWNNDGMDIVDCKNVLIKGCFVNSADDGICFKSFDPSYTSENLVVKKCKIRTSASGIKFGTASYGNFKNAEINHIYCYDNYRTVIAIESVDGGIIDNFKIKNIKGRNVGGAFFIRLGKRRNTVGELKNISFKNVDIEIGAGKPDGGYENEGPVAEDVYPHNTLPSSIIGIPEASIDGVKMKNIKINLLTKTPAYFIPTPEKDNRVPLLIKAYPEFSMFGELPAWGIFIRDANNLDFKKVVLKVNGSDYRSAITASNVSRLYFSDVKIAQDKMPIPFSYEGVKDYKFQGISLPRYYTGENVEVIKP